MKNEINQDSTILESEILDLEARRSQLVGEVERAVLDHQQQREGLIRRDAAHTADSVSAAHSRLLALQEALSSVADGIEAKKSELRQAKVAEHRRAALNRIAEATRLRDAAEQRFLEARQGANDAMRQRMGEMMAASEQHRALAVELSDLHKSLGTQRTIDRITTPRIEPFGYEVDIAYRKFTNEQDRLRHKEAVRAREREKLAASAA
jgi:hypothetical protein